jgi:AcrR family transcriptional regulator
MALPRGRHSLSTGEVQADQRRRMLDGIAGALAERGYARLTVDDILKRSGISRRTFYEQFGDKDDCLFTAYEDAERRAWASAAAAAADLPPGDWPGQVHAALGALLEFVAAEPDTARLFTLEARAAGPAMGARHGAALDRLASTLKDGNRRAAMRGLQATDPGGASPLPESTERTLAGNVAALVGSYVLSGATELLPSLEPQLAEHLLTPYLEAVEQEPVRPASLAASRGPR